MYNLFITHTPNGVCYLLAKDTDGNVFCMLLITPTAFFDLREKAIPEIPMAENETFKFTFK